MKTETKLASLTVALALTAGSAQAAADAAAPTATINLLKSLRNTQTSATIARASAAPKAQEGGYIGLTDRIFSHDGSVK